MQRVKVNLKERSYSVYIKRGILSDLSGVFSEIISPGSRIALFASKTVDRFYRKSVQKSLNDAGYKVDFILMPSGEAHKNLETINGFYQDLISKKYDRGCCIVALGGGVTGDTAGFVAATLFRGIDLIQIPTTLLAQVDSSIGGKTGVNHAMGKNLIGSIYQPKAVIIDPDVLQTLKRRERVSGFGEIIKYGLICDKVFTEYCFERLEQLIEFKNMDDIGCVIRRSVEIKSDVVARDEQESGLRMILNFGHTIGHAVEVTSGYGTFRHGEAVILGMVAALKLSSMCCGFSSKKTQYYSRKLLSIPLGKSTEDLEIDAIVNAVKLDKKVRGGRPNFVLLEEVGQPVIRHDITDEMIYDAVKWLKVLAAEGAHRD